MDSITGFIVAVRTKDSSAAPYIIDGKTNLLHPSEELLGYFQSISLPEVGAKEGTGHLIETVPINYQKRHFYWGKKISFKTADMHVEIRANRGGNRPPRGYEFLETWYIRRNAPSH